jgi:tetratricopeptide (TPR) repeat protein
MKLLFILSFLCITHFSQGQLLKKLKEKVQNKAEDKAEDVKYDAKRKAKDMAYKDLEEYRAGFDSTDIDYALLLSDNAGLFGTRGRGKEAGARFIQFASVANSLYKDRDLSDEENARINLQVGQSAYASGKFVYAEKRLSAAKSYFEKATMEDDLPYMKTLSTQGLLYTSMGRYEQAEKLTDDVLKMRVEKFGEENMGVAASVNNAAVLHYNLGRYNEAEKEFEKAIGIIKANNQSATMPYAIVLNNKAILYQSIGRFDAGAKLLEEALQIASTLQSNKSKNHLKFFSNLALLYQQMGKYSEAERIYQGLEKRLDRGKPEFANMLNNLAILYIIMQKDAPVEDMLKKAAGIYKTTMTDKSPAYAKAVSDLGNYLRYKGRYDDALPMLEGVIEKRLDLLGTDHPLYVQSLEDLAILYWKKKEITKA